LTHWFLTYILKTVLLIFALLVAEYAYQTYHHRMHLTPAALLLWHTRRFKIFCSALVAAYIFILVRCAYRIPELLGGWGGELMRIELEFILLEGVMITLAVLAQTMFHPGSYFPALASTSTKQRHRRLENVDDATEMELLGGYEHVRPRGRYEDLRPVGGYEDMRSH
jgi:hypothetical protein